MKNSLTAWIGHLLQGVFLLVLVAVVLGHLASDSPTFEWSPTERRPASTWSYMGNYQAREARFLDVCSGAVIRVDFPEGNRLDQASSAPWRDRRDQRLIVGRWQRVNGANDSLISEDLGLALIRVPDGHLIAKVSTEVWPVSPPCWFPGERPRILFAAANAQLYHFDLGTLEYDSGLSSQVPEQITLGEGVFPEHEFLLFEPNWLVAGSPLDFIVVSVHVRGPRQAYFGPRQIWWLRLDPSGTRIEDAGPLIQVEPGRNAAAPQQYRPVLSRSDEGELILLYVERQEGRSSCRLRGASVRVDPETNRPWAKPGPVLDEVEQINAHALSADGRWVYSITKNLGKPAEVHRIPLSGGWLAKMHSGTFPIE